MLKTSLEISDVEVSIFAVDENGRRGEPYTVLKSKKRRRKGEPGFEGYIEVAAGQRYGVDILLHPTFDFLKQPTLSACISHNIDGGDAIHFAGAIQRTDKTRRDEVYGLGDDGCFAFARAQLDKDGPPFGTIEVQLTRGDGRFIPVTQENRFGHMAKDTDCLSTMKGVEADKDNKDLYPGIYEAGDKWLDWANDGNIPDLLSPEQRAERPVNELLIFQFHYRTKDWLVRNRIKRTNKRTNKRRKVQSSPRSLDTEIDNLYNAFLGD